MVHYGQNLLKVSDSPELACSPALEAPLFPLVDDVYVVFILPPEAVNTLVPSSLYFVPNREVLSDLFEWLSWILWVYVDVNDKSG